MLYAWVAWLGIVLIIQAVYAFWRGVYVPFFMSHRGQSTVSLWSRLRGGMIYGGSGIGLLAVTMGTFLRGLETRRSFVVPGGILCIAGTVFLVKPTIAVKWAQDAYPDLSMSDPFSLAIVRAVGGILLLFGLLFLTIQ
jgi:hypothetical protein